MVRVGQLTSDAIWAASSTLACTHHDHLARLVQLDIDRRRALRRARYAQSDELREKHLKSALDTERTYLDLLAMEADRT